MSFKYAKLNLRSLKFLRFSFVIISLYYHGESKF